jgi:citrate lyase subunit beta/citryl-CoA lyase
MTGYRSVLFVPGNRPAWLGNAVASGADCLVLDLEDSVPDTLKETTRAQVRESVQLLAEEHPQLAVYVRVNPLATGLAGADLEAVVGPGLAGVFTPKVESALDLVRFDALLDHFERRNGAGGLRYIIPVETVPAIQNCREIAAASPRTAAMIGPTSEHADIAREVGFEWTPEGLESLYLRSRVLLACREAGVHPLTALWEDLDDLEGLGRFARSGRRLGFGGMVAIHPAHVSVINEVFSPTEQTLEFYIGLVLAYEAGVREGAGAVRYRGAHIDKAHYDKALERLADPGRGAPHSDRSSKS